jgi:hypothetical protein
MRIRNLLEQKNQLNFGNELTLKSLSVDENLTSIENLDSLKSVEIEDFHSFKSLDSKFEINDFKQRKETDKENSMNFVDQISNKVLNSSNKNLDKDSLIPDNKTSPFMIANNPMPFYAGWDESSRKFVVTNRLLSRKEAGYSFYNKKTKEDYLKAPLNGMNAPTTLYWQVPFTTYDPDQFFALGMDGFSPIGWRHFNFKFSKQTTKPILVKEIKSTLISQSNKFSKDLHIKFINKNFGSQLNFSNSNLKSKGFEPGIPLESSIFKSLESNNQEKRLNQMNQYRRIQKRYKRVKKHPRPPVWFPSGALANQVLPVHYIYVFYKRYRLPRDRYVRRKLRRQKNEDLNLNLKNFNQWTDYTLRKRSKPKRKYHRKNVRMKRKNEDFLSHLKRRKFREFADENDRFRPISESQKLKELKIRKKRMFKDKKNMDSTKKQKGSKDNIRFRQLRRRVLRQVFRPVWRYKPQTGGFVWPGDYLRLELVKAPKLQTNSFSNNPSLKISEKQRNIRKKKRRIIQEWQIQPKKYLLQKHNLKALKKRSQKSQN